jgi:uncharacterized protein
LIFNNAIEFLKTAKKIVFLVFDFAFVSMDIFDSVDTPLEVWAYGSRVNGTAHSGSDLDLVVRSQNLSKLPIDAYVYLCEKIRNSNIPILVELRDWAMLPDSFHKNILQQYEVLYSSLIPPQNEFHA